jgi:hypothetical protein
VEPLVAATTHLIHQICHAAQRTRQCSLLNVTDPIWDTTLQTVLYSQRVPALVWSHLPNPTTAQEPSVRVSTGVIPGFPKQVVWLPSGIGPT